MTKDFTPYQDSIELAELGKWLDQIEAARKSAPAGAVLLVLTLDAEVEVSLNKGPEWQEGQKLQRDGQVKAAIEACPALEESGFVVLPQPPGEDRLGALIKKALCA